MLAFGAFVIQQGSRTLAWTTGQDFFGRTNFIRNDPERDSPAAMMAIFGLGRMVVHGRRLRASDGLIISDLRARLMAAERDGTAYFRVVVQD